MELFYTRFELFQILKESTSFKVKEKLQYLESKVCELAKCQGKADKLLVKKCLKSFEHFFIKYWTAAERKEDFLTRFDEWLAGIIIIPSFCSSSTGRPPKDFNEASERSNRRKTEEIRRKLTKEEITYAASMSQRAAGNNDAATIILSVAESADKARTCRRSLSTSEDNPIMKNSPEDALEIFINADLSKNQYEVIQKANKNVYPCYSLVKNAKKDCYPREDDITITETLIEV